MRAEDGAPSAEDYAWADAALGISTGRRRRKLAFRRQVRFVVFDSGALIAIERGSRKVQTLLERINALGTIVLVPTGVVASVGVCAREHGRDVAVLTSDSTDLRKLDGTLPIVAI